jgi:hypothetical protein
LEESPEQGDPAGGGGVQLRCQPLRRWYSVAEAALQSRAEKVRRRLAVGRAQQAAEALL